MIITVKELVEALSKYDDTCKVRVYEAQPHFQFGVTREQSGVIIYDHDDRKQVGIVETRNSY